MAVQYATHTHCLASPAVKLAEGAPDHKNSSSCMYKWIGFQVV